jgi:hypothetical protein
MSPMPLGPRARAELHPAASPRGAAAGTPRRAPGEGGAVARAIERGRSVRTSPLFISGGCDE